MNNRQFSLLGIPINCQGVPGGTESSPRVLREAGFVEAIGARDLGDLNVRIDNHRRDQESGVIGIDSVCYTASTVRAAVKELLDQGKRPFLLGGCCVEVIGAVAGARDHFGKIALAYVDGHIDLYDGKTSPTGEAADMPMALMLGVGPKRVVRLLGAGATLEPQQVALIGPRDMQEAKSLGSIMPSDFKPPLMFFDVNSVRMIGAKTIASDVVAAFAKSQSHFWLHVDFDVLDPAEFFAVDYLMPNGMTWQELVDTCVPLCQSEALIGMSIACYNPDKDKHNHCAKTIVEKFAQIMRLAVPSP